MSEILAEAPVRAKSPLATLTEGNTAADMRARYRSAAALLDQAWNTDEADLICHSGESDRLLRVAAEFTTYRGHNDGFEASELENDAFTVGALISASRMVPGDDEGPKRAALLAEVIALLRPVASDEEGEAAEFGVPMAPRPARALPLSQDEAKVRDTLLDLLRPMTNLGTDVYIHEDVERLVMLAYETLERGIQGHAREQFFSDAASLLAGAMAVHRNDAKGHAAHAEAMAKAHRLADETWMSYGFGLAGAQAQATAIDAAQAGGKAAVAPTKSLTAAQLESVLAHIAGRALLLRSLLIHASATDDRTTCLLSQQAAEALAEEIGALADDAIGGDVAGDFHSWHYGPNFADAGKAGAA